MPPSSRDRIDCVSFRPVVTDSGRELYKVGEKDIAHGAIHELTVLEGGVSMPGDDKKPLWFDSPARITKQGTSWPGNPHPSFGRPRFV